jgi:hypothetical protein
MCDNQPSVYERGGPCVTDQLGQASSDETQGEEIKFQIQLPDDWAEELEAEFKKNFGQDSEAHGEIKVEDIASDDANFIITTGVVVIAALWVANTGGQWAFTKTLDTLFKKVRGRKTKKKDVEPVATVLLPNGVTVRLDASNPDLLAKNIERITATVK